jgi:hypothetical protein
MRRLGAVVVLGSLVIAACGGGGGDGDSSSAPAGTSGDGDSAITTPADDAAPVDTAAEESEDADAPVVPPAPSSGDGSCDVTVSGDKQAEWSGGGTLADVGVSYWYSDAEKGIVGDAFGVILNCVSDGVDSLSIVSGSTADEASIPQAPGTFQLTPDGGPSGSDLFAVLITLEDSETNWRVADPGGTLTIIEFDDDSITGTFEFPMEDALAEISGDPSEGRILITGNFDFNKPPTS